MFVRGLSFRFFLLSLAVLAAVIRTSQAGCTDTASDCTSCSSCTNVVYTGTSILAHVWISDIDDPNNPGSFGTCTDIYSPQKPLISNIRPTNQPPFCNKRVFDICTPAGSVSSNFESCASTPPPSPNPGTCKASPQYCFSCGDCLAIFRTSDGAKTYYWVASDPNAANDRDTAGTCVERFDPPTTGSLRSVDSKDLCGKRVFVACSFSLTQSTRQSCPFVSQVSAGSALQVSTTVTASLVAAFAVCLIFN
jgi:hypothetical protein